MRPINHLALALLLASTAACHGNATDQRPVSKDEADDPDAIFDDASVEQIADFARRLSADPHWRSAEITAALAAGPVDLDVIYGGVPRLVEHKGVRYHLELVAGGDWTDVTSASKPLVYLTHELYRPEEDRVLAFADGASSLASEVDLRGRALIELSLREIAPLEQVAASIQPQSLLRPIDLGTAKKFEAPAKPVIATAVPGEVAPGCPDLTCSTGYKPFFILTGIRINDNHEGFGMGTAELEAYIAREGSPAGGASDVSTRVIFDGQSHADMTGRSVVLPNVNDEKIWYYVNGGYALLPFGDASKWEVMLVEDDDTKGKLKLQGATIDQVFGYVDRGNRLLDSWGKIDFKWIVDALKLLRDVITGTSADDLYQPNFAIDKVFYKNAVCSAGVPWSTVFTFGTTSDESMFQGYFACLPN